MAEPIKNHEQPDDGGTEVEEIPTTNRMLEKDPVSCKRSEINM